MALIATCMIDTSAIARMRMEVVSIVLEPLIERGLVSTCAALDYEALYSSRSPQDYEDIRFDRELAYEYLPTLDTDWKRALSVQGELASQSRTREVGLSDLLIAAVAEREDVTLIHYDADYETIAEITGQRVQWVAERGSL